jgi:sterol desaturase/sphingolipid hydroxylase (fatty acid hydroxylase superfamily)
METLRHLQQSLPPLAVDVIRLCIWLLLLVVIFVPLEKLWARHRQKLFRKGFWIDLAYYFISSLLPIRLLTPLMLTVAWALHDFIPPVLHGWSATLPLWLRFVVAMIVGEIGSYWGHRWMHEIPWLWRFHAVHHSAEQLDWLVNTRAHPMDIVFTRLCGFIPMYVLGLVVPAGNALDVVTLLVIVLGTVWGFFIHANLRWRLGWLEWLVSSPAFHHWHHNNDDPGLLNKNYAAMLPWVDRLFGSFYLPRREWPKSYGINGAMPAGLWRQVLHPFLPAAGIRDSSS